MEILHHMNRLILYFQKENKGQIFYPKLIELFKNPTSLYFSIRMKSFNTF